ncbi:unnamed protein product [Prorocentrum cordatum]|uniref:Uncharacterized protein n=1 Tax=Prorocentrum cordatum TaxID=2364126 RepID=A0ABN9RKB7_9DINO|nr:unnamed protein product [Polarella glacialis]
MGAMLQQSVLEEEQKQLQQAMEQSRSSVVRGELAAPCGIFGAAEAGSAVKAVSGASSSSASEQDRWSSQYPESVYAVMSMGFPLEKCIQEPNRIPLGRGQPGGHPGLLLPGAGPLRPPARAARGAGEPRAALAAQGPAGCPRALRFPPAPSPCGPSLPRHVSSPSPMGERTRRPASTPRCGSLPRRCPSGSARPGPAQKQRSA